MLCQRTVTFVPVVEAERRRNADFPVGPRAGWKTGATALVIHRLTIANK